MRVDVAQISMNVTLNQAQANAQTKVLKTQAQAGTFLTIQKSQASAYAGLMNNLTFNRTNLIEFMQVQLVKNHPEGRLVISLKDE